MAASNDLERQIEAAFDYRGYVTLRLKNGERVVGYVYNRQFAHPKLQEPAFIEIFLAGNGDSHKLAIDAIHAVELTGKNYAATDSPSHETAGTEPANPSGDWSPQ
jgi:hypothetical protein